MNIRDQRVCDCLCLFVVYRLSDAAQKHSRPAREIKVMVTKMLMYSSSQAVWFTCVHWESAWCAVCIVYMYMYTDSLVYTCTLAVCCTRVHWQSGVHVYTGSLVYTCTSKSTPINMRDHESACIKTSGHNTIIIFNVNNVLTLHPISY